MCLNHAAEDGLIVANAALRMPRLPPAHIERDYLRLEEIPRYLDACSQLYRPLAELLIGSGLRIFNRSRRSAPRGNDPGVHARA